MRIPGLQVVKDTGIYERSFLCEGVNSEVIEVSYCANTDTMSCETYPDMSYDEISLYTKNVIVPGKNGAIEKIETSVNTSDPNYIFFILKRQCKDLIEKAESSKENLSLNANEIFPSYTYDFNGNSLLEEWTERALYPGDEGLSEYYRSALDGLSTNWAYLKKGVDSGWETIDKN